MRKYTVININITWHTLSRGCCGRDRIIVGFTTIYAISVYHH